MALIGVRNCFQRISLFSREFERRPTCNTKWYVIMWKQDTRFVHI